MTNAESLRTHEKNWSEERKKNLVNHLVRPVGSAALVLGLAGGTVAAGAEILKETHIGSTTVYLESGDTPIDGISEGVKRIAETEGIDPNTVKNIVGAGQEVAKELGELHPGKPAQIGDELEVEVVKNGLGQYSAKADPASPDNLAYLTK